MVGLLTAYETLTLCLCLDGAPSTPSMQSTHVHLWPAHLPVHKKLGGVPAFGWAEQQLIPVWAGRAKLVRFGWRFPRLGRS